MRKSILAGIIAVSISSMIILPTYATNENIGLELDSLQCPVNRACGSGYEFSYIEFPEPFYFTATKDDVPVKDIPYREGTPVTYFDERDSFLIDGIVRNERDSLWLHVKETGWIFIDNISYLFERNVANFYLIISKSGAVDVNFINVVKEDGKADIRSYLDPGNRGITYNIDIDGVRYNMRAEDIGNMNYGSLGRMLGYPTDLLLNAGGFDNVFNSVTQGELSLKVIEECLFYHCDHQDDYLAISVGAELYDSFGE